MSGFLKFLCGLASLAMIFFYGVYVSNNIFNYLPYSDTLINLLNNVVYFAPMLVCALASVVAVWNMSLVRWLVLVAWIIIIVASFIPGDIVAWLS